MGVYILAVVVSDSAYIGPWYVGEIISGKYGLVTAHGVFVDGHFLPGSMTYFRGAYQVSLQQEHSGARYRQ